MSSRAVKCHSSIYSSCGTRWRTWMKRRLPNEIQQSSPSRALATAQLEVHPLRSIGTVTHTHTLGVGSLVKCACASGPWRLGSIVSHWNRWAGIGDRNANGRKRESHLALSNETAPIAYPNCNCKTASTHTHRQTDHRHRCW